MFDVFYLTKKPNLFAHERHANSIEHAIAMSKTRYCWIVNYLCDYKSFDFLWEPVPWEAHQRHAWSSIWQPDSGTYLIPKQGSNEINYHVANLTTTVDKDLWESLSNIDKNFDLAWHPDYSDPPYIYQFGTQWQKTGGPRYVVPGASEVKYVNQIRIQSRCKTDIVYLIDHSDQNFAQARQSIVDQLTNADIKKVRYIDNYLDTLGRIAKTAQAQNQEFVWICSSLCDYSQFDFSWHPEQWQTGMLHVFASNEQKFGDTFFMHVPSFVRNAAQDIELLDWYDINFVDALSVPRWPMPVIIHDFDTHTDAVKNLYTITDPLVLFQTQSQKSEDNLPTVPLWREKTKTVTPLSKGASSVIVPRSAFPYIRTQIYDYPWIDRTYQQINNDIPLDIVFISNGEPKQEKHWELLRERCMNIPNRLARVHGITGRVKAYHAAANSSNTPWLFIVVSKLEINEDFDWSWQPDRLQQPKHYIFHALNSVNGLVYGHQAVIAYNKSLALSTTGKELDFALESEHQVVPILSGIAHCDQSPLMAWQTAFRESIKLKNNLPDVDSEYRLQKWLTVSNTDVGKWCCQGARDGIEYHEKVKGDPFLLQNSYDWAWLASYAREKHNLQPDS